MRFSLTLQITGRHRILPINYQYPLHSWVYRVIQQADAEFSRFLHNEGYTIDKQDEAAQRGAAQRSAPRPRWTQRFKLFTFSPLKGEPYRLFKEEQRIGFYGEALQLQVSFWLPEAAEHFIRGLFMGQRFRLGDRISQVDLEVVRIEALPRPLFKEMMCYRAVSPVVVSVRMPNRKHPQYLAPDEETYTQRLLMNLQRKAEAVKLDVSTLSGISTATGSIEEPSEGWEGSLQGNFRKKGILVKQHTPMQNKIIGYTYDIEMTAPPEIQQLAYYAGLGEDNSMGFGYIEEIKGWKN